MPIQVKCIQYIYTPIFSRFSVASITRRLRPGDSSVLPAATGSHYWQSPLKHISWTHKCRCKILKNQQELACSQATLCPIWAGNMSKPLVWSQGAQKISNFGYPGMFKVTVVFFHSMHSRLPLAFACCKHVYVCLCNKMLIIHSFTVSWKICMSNLFLI